MWSRVRPCCWSMTILKGCVCHTQTLHFVTLITPLDRAIFLEYTVKMLAVPRLPSQASGANPNWLSCQDVVLPCCDSVPFTSPVWSFLRWEEGLIWNFESLVCNGWSQSLSSRWSQSGVVATHCVLHPPLLVAKYLSICWVEALIEFLYPGCAWEKPNLSTLNYVPGWLTFFWLHVSHPRGPTMTSLLAVFSLSRAGQ